MKLSDIKIKKRFRKDLGDIDSLAKSIKKIGLLHPIVVDEEDNLIAGLRRIEACKKLGWTEIPHFEVNLKDLLEGERSENVDRKDFTPTEAREIWEALKIREEDEAKKRQKEAGKRFGRGIIASAKLAEAIEGESRDKAAKATGYGHTTLAKITELTEAAKINPEYEKLIEQMNDTSKVDGAFQKYKKIEAEREKKKRFKQAKDKAQAKILQGNAIELLDKIPDRSFDCLLTDPPYSTEIDNFEDFLDQWVSKACAKIKLTGRIYICSGPYINELLAYISILKNIQDFIFGNLLIWSYKNALGPKPKLRYKYSWNGIFYLYGEDAPPLQSPLTKDIFDHFEFSLPDGRREIKYHPHQKPEKLIEQLIVLSTEKGQSILDLFAGSGTIGLTASLLGRPSLLIEKESKNIKICEKRGLNLCRDDQKMFAFNK